MAQFSAQEDSFAAVPPILAELRGLEVSESTVERTAVEVGEALVAANQARAAATLRTERAAAGALEHSAVAPEAGEPSPARLYLAMDGMMCPQQDPWRRDRSLGKLVCRYGEAKVGIAFTTGQKEGLDTGIVTRGCIGTLGNIAVFTLLMLALARPWGAPQAQELVVLGNGAECPLGVDLEPGPAVLPAGGANRGPLARAGTRLDRGGSEIWEPDQRGGQSLGEADAHVSGA